MSYETTCAREAARVARDAAENVRSDRLVRARAGRSYLAGLVLVLAQAVDSLAAECDSLRSIINSRTEHLA